jgi:pimeloyl-ACP methyl ester carboxylesterase
MKTLLHTLTLSMLLLTVACSQQAQISNEDKMAHAPKSVLAKLEPYSTDAIEKAGVTAEWGVLEAPENRSNVNSRKISVPFIRLLAQTDTPAPPIFILNGGPGDTPTPLETFDQYVPILKNFLVRSDVVMVEQRGVGFAQPALSCEGSYDLTASAPINYQEALEKHERYLITCAKAWKAKGVDLGGYNVKELAADVNDVRETLNYDKISILGGSFGSFLGFSMLRDYSETIDRAVLMQIEGPNHSAKLPSTYQQHLLQLQDQINQQADLKKRIPNIVTLIEELSHSLNEAPATYRVQHPSNNEPVEISMGEADLKLAIAISMGRYGVRDIPAHLIDIETGNYEWLANVSKYIRFNRHHNLMKEIVDCSSGATQERLETIEAESLLYTLGNSANWTHLDSCRAFTEFDIGDEQRSAFKSSVPTLLINGTEDARTPMANMHEVAKYFDKVQTITVTGGTHDLFQEAMPLIIPSLMSYLTSNEIPVIKQSKVSADFTLTTRD